MSKPPETEETIGLKHYQTETRGLGGKTRLKYDDFIVEEVLQGFKASPKRVCKGNVSCDKYYIYILEKKGVDTLEAIRKISRNLNIKAYDIGFAGLKDANALTFQFISLKGPKTLPCILNIDDSIKLYFFSCSSKRIVKGENWGNCFLIKIRDTDVNTDNACYEVFEEILSEICSIGGLYPYFGHQRFGTIRPNTHRVGEKIVRRDWFGAVLELIGNPYPKEDPQVYEARKVFSETLDPKRALRLFPKKFIYERIVLKKLVEGRGYVDALLALPKHILKFYVEAFQAYLFNEYVNLRIEKGIKPNTAIEGDIVVKNGFFEKVLRERRIDPKEKVLLPLVGYMTKMGKGEAYDILKSVLESRNVKLSMFKIRELNITVKGGFRKSPMIIHNLSYACLERCLHLYFCLEKGMYATVFLREVMKNEYVV